MPDYEHCSTAELYDVLDRIDALTYPDRAAAVREELRRRSERPPSGIAAIQARTPPWIFRVTRTGLALYVLVAGLFGFGAVVDGWPASASAGTLAILIPLLGLFGTQVLAGSLMLARIRWAIELAIGALLPQIPLFQIGRLIYVITTPPALEVKLWPLTGFGVSTGFTINLAWSDAQRPFYLGINMTALSALAMLTYHVDRRNLARRRLSSMRQTRPPGGSARPTGPHPPADGRMGDPS